MLCQKFPKALHQYRIVLSLLFLLTILYFVAFNWLTLPPLTLVLGWRPDTTLVVLSDVERGYSPMLQPGDRILAINGRVVQRGKLIFEPPVKPVYRLTLQRGDAIITQDVTIPKSDLFRPWLLSIEGLAIAFWGIGLLTVLFARSDQRAALYVGLAWQLIGAGIASPGPSQLGAPGAWLVGQVLIFLFPLIMLWLAFVPQQTPLPMVAQRLLQGCFLVVASMAVVATIEAIWLFPTLSLQELVGVSTLTVLTGLSGISVLAAIAIMFSRLRRTPAHSYERQQLTILFVCLMLAVTPLFFFVILPASQYLFVPYPFIYSLFLLIPAGYFFVLHRSGYLALDIIFSRLITIIVLIIAVATAYATGTYLLDKVFHWNLGGAGQGGFILIVLGVVASSQKQVQSFIDLLLYGREQLGFDTIQDAKSRLSANPEPATIADVIAQVAAYLSVTQVAVLTKHQEQYILLAGNMPEFIVPDSSSHQRVRLRTREASRMVDLPEWVELSIPITARGDILGLFILSRPVNGYFTARQVATLQDIADILAFGLLVISLVESMDSLSRQALYEKELQRQQIATEIHNEPLQTLGNVTMQLHRAASDQSVREAVETIRQVTTDLRRIIAGLRPPALKESVEWMTQQVINEFAETHENLDVQLQLDVQSERRAPEQTKLAFYYILTEALNNVSKHAQATIVTIKVHYDEQMLHLLICDNGVGGKAAIRSLTGLLREQHIGVADMHRWALIGGGKLKIRPNEPTGTIVDLTLPLTTWPDSQP
jgi:signal transduction histidine kinase